MIAQKILSAKFAGDLFTNNRGTMKKEYLELSKKWHPDCNGNSTESNEVMTVINEMYVRALKLIDENKWESSTVIRVSCKSKKAYDFPYKVIHNFELGKAYIGEYYVLYLLRSEHKQLYENGIRNIKGFKFSSDRMKDEMMKYLPIIQEEFETTDGYFGVVIKKTPDLFLLRDVLEYYKGKIPDRHVAWILSRLYNIACYINFNGCMNNGITVDSFFISPLHHGAALLGGWWYSGRVGTIMTNVPKDVYSILPPTVKGNKVSNIVTDLESVKLIGRTLLGEGEGYKLKSNTEIPKPFINWLLAGSSDDAVNEYTKWGETLKKSFGERRFVVMNLSSDDLYK